MLLSIYSWKFFILLCYKSIYLSHCILSNVQIRPRVSTAIFWYIHWSNLMKARRRQLHWVVLCPLPFLLFNSGVAKCKESLNKESDVKYSICSTWYVFGMAYSPCPSQSPKFNFLIFKKCSGISCTSRGYTLPVRATLVSKGDSTLSALLIVKKSYFNGARRRQ